MFNDIISNSSDYRFYLCVRSSPIDESFRVPCLLYTRKFENEFRLIALKEDLKFGGVTKLSSYTGYEYGCNPNSIEELFNLGSLKKDYKYCYKPINDEEFLEFCNDPELIEIKKLKIENLASLYRKLKLKKIENK